jgi:tRNA(fMet)-specific endonuclease VapC
MRFLLDTDTCVDVLKGEPRVLSNLARQSPDDCAVSIVTAYELFTGVEKCADPDRERFKVNRLLDSLHVIAFEEQAARTAAAIRAYLEAMGTPIGPYDTLIAGQALAHGLLIVTHNAAEFSRVNGLERVDWRTTGESA